MGVGEKVEDKESSELSLENLKIALEFDLLSEQFLTNLAGNKKFLGENPEIEQFLLKNLDSSGLGVLLKTTSNELILAEYVVEGKALEEIAQNESITPGLAEHYATVGTDAIALLLGNKSVKVDLSIFDKSIFDNEKACLAMFGNEQYTLDEILSCFSESKTLLDIVKKKKFQSVISKREDVGGDLYKILSLLIEDRRQERENRFADLQSQLEKVSGEVKALTPKK